MTQPRIEFIPLKFGVNRDAECILDLIVRVTPPALKDAAARLPANLALVIDRSGSMGGEKIEYARRAAIEAVGQLGPEDRVSVVAFDDHVEVVTPSTHVRDRAEIARAIERIDLRGSTALHGGWLEGGVQVAAYLRPDTLNRVLVFTDGQANVGETNQDTIATQVCGLQERGVSTSAYGIGRDFNEDLLVAMAQAGDGNFEFISHPSQLPSLLNAELQGLKATFGRRASLGLKPQGGVTVQDVLNDYPVTQFGRLMLPNLIAGRAVTTIVRLKAQATGALQDLLHVRVAWDDSRTAARHEYRSSLRLPSVTAGEFESLPSNSEVLEAVALLLAAREKLEYMRHLDSGDFASARLSSGRARNLVQAAAYSPAAGVELDNLTGLDEALSSGDANLARKRASAQRYGRVQSKPSGE